ncbi:MAG: glycosyltransferase family 9 protein, partial [Candidatus Omnitrophica bacterium]|nr:glycosyltransferase family 9 protein [Candidatus Omnitrophota bacterium]
MKRILVVNLNWLGDVVLTTPAFKALKEKEPSAYLAVMVVERLRPVFDDNPYIDEVISFDERTSEKSFLSKLRFIARLRKKKFDTAFLVHRSFTRALICFLAGIKQRIGQMRFKTNLILTKKIPPLPAGEHRQDSYLNIFTGAGISINDKKPQVYLPKNFESNVIKEIFALGKEFDFLIGIHVAGNWLPKRWPKDFFASLSDRLILELAAGVVFTGAKKDMPAVADVIRLMKEKPFDFSGKTSLKDLAALIQRMDFFISNDSGPAHLAAGLSVPTLVLFGPTSEKL